jgi:putative transposase
MQSAQLPGSKEARPDYRDINAQVLQDVLHRLDRTFQAFFRRVMDGETPCYPRFQGMGRCDSFTYPQVGEHGGAVLEGGVLSLSKIGRIRIPLHRPIEGHPKAIKISKEAHGWYACISCAEVQMQPLPTVGHQTGIALDIEAFATLSDGTRIFHPGWYPGRTRSENRATARFPTQKGSHRRDKAVTLLTKAHQQMRRQRQDFHHKTALTLVQQYASIYHENYSPPPW